MGLKWSCNKDNSPPGSEAFYSLPEGGGKSRLPKRIILVRHGQSEGNVDEAAYGRTPDSQISLTLEGNEQAKLLGKKIKAIVGNGTSNIQSFYLIHLG